jgi:hypothetical protein
MCSAGAKSAWTYAFFGACLWTDGRLGRATTGGRMARPMRATETCVYETFPRR